MAHVTASQLQTFANGFAAANDARFAKITDILDSVESTATNVPAAPKSVKTAYDAAVAAQQTANGKQSPATTIAGYGITDAYTKTEVDSKMTSAYKASGTKAANDLTSSLLVVANEGKVYNLSSALTITNENKGFFTENATGTYPAGTNVVVIEGTEARYVVSEDEAAQDGKVYYTRSGEEGSYTYTEAEVEDGADLSGGTYYEYVAATYLFDVLAGFVDLSGYATTSDLNTATADADDDDITAIVSGLYGDDDNT